MNKMKKEDRKKDGDGQTDRQTEQPVSFLPAREGRIWGPGETSRNSRCPARETG